MNVSFLGPACAGKGTYARELCPRFGLVHVATGDVLRLAMEAGTPSGQLAKRYMERGDLVPDEIVEEMVEDWVHMRGADGILFDGFPRTVEQARFIDALLGAGDHQLDLVVYLEVDPEQIARRLAGRFTCEVCQSTFHERFRPPAEPGVCDVCGGPLFRRADGNPAILHTRLDGFRRNIAPVLRHYRSRDRLAQVDANGTIEEVKQRLATHLGSLARGEVSAEQLPGGADITVPGRIALPPARPSVDLVLLGGPGSGKGTQAARFAEVLGVPHISTGELFRENLAEQTELGRLAKSYMDHGELVPDDITEAMVRERLSRPDTERGFILDGYPRTRAQAESLDAMLAEIGRRLTAALNIRVSDDEIFRRLAGRGREDDDPQTVKTRLKTFHIHNGSLLDYYREAGLLHEIDGEGTPEEVTARARAELEPLVTAR